MSAPIIKTSTELNQAKTLLGKSVPMHRKAYSDRTAWLMACFAELAYMKFNPPIINPRLGNSIERMLNKSMQDTRKLKTVVQLAIYRQSFYGQYVKRF